MAEEIHSIQVRTDINLVKSKRSTRRGQMTRLQRRLQAFESEPLRDLKLTSVRQVYQSAVDTSRIHDALQSRYDDLFSEYAGGDEDKIAAETSKDQDIQASHSEIIDKAVEWVERLSLKRERVSVILSIPS